MNELEESTIFIISIIMVLWILAGCAADICSLMAEKEKMEA